MATYTTTQSADDAQEVVASQIVTLTDATIALNGTHHAGFRFIGTGVGQGVTITSAIFTFDQLQTATGSGNLNHLTVYGEAQDYAVDFTTAAHNISGRARTTANKAANTLGADTTTWVTSGVDVTAIVQEIVNRPGWLTGSALSILFIADGTAGNNISPYTWDYFSGTYLARLTITVAATTSTSSSSSTTSTSTSSSTSSSTTHSTSSSSSTTTSTSLPPPIQGDLRVHPRPRTSRTRPLHPSFTVLPNASRMVLRYMYNFSVHLWYLRSGTR